ncbi:MAG: HAD-IB family hydrolase [Ilumatobacteraceae bacterium]
MTTETSQASDSSVRIVAAFDLDKTLTTRDCVLPFLWRAGRWGFAGHLIVRLPTLFIAGLRRDRDRAKAILTRSALRGRVADEIGELGREFADHVVSSWLRPDTTARLRWHLGVGHDVVIVSASYEAYVRHIAERLGARTALATRLAVDTAGLCTGDLDGDNCRGSEKVSRLRTWFADEGLTPEVIYAYGDSGGDRHLLEMASYPHLVGKTLLADRPEAAS